MTPTPTPRRIQVTCPSCGEATWFAPDNPYRPFCSARCQGLDFGAWASEHYRVQATPGPHDLSDPHPDADADA